MVWLWAPDGSAQGAAPPLVGAGGPNAQGQMQGLAGQGSAASLDFQAPGLRPWQRGWSPLAGPSRLAQQHGFPGGPNMLPGGQAGGQPLGAAGGQGQAAPSTSLPGGGLPSGMPGRLPGVGRSMSPDAQGSGLLPVGMPDRIPAAAGARSASPARPGVNGFAAAEMGMQVGSERMPSMQSMQGMQPPTPGAPMLQAPMLGTLPAGNAGALSQTPLGGPPAAMQGPPAHGGSMADLLRPPAKDNGDYRAAGAQHGHVTPPRGLSPTPSVQIFPASGPTEMRGKQVAPPQVITVQQTPQQFPNGHPGASQLHAAMQSLLRAEQAPGQAVAMPTSLLARINSVVSEMERELAEEDGPEQQEYHPAQASQQPPTPDNVRVLESEQTLDWLDQQIWAIEQRRTACEMRQGHLAELRKLVADGEADNFHGSVGAAESGGVLVGNAEGMCASDDEVDGLVEAPRSRLSMLEADHNLLKKQVLEYEHERTSAQRDPDGAARARVALEEELNITRNAAEKAAEVANERLQQVVMETQDLYSRLREAEAAADKERQFSEEAVEAQQSAEADLRTLEEKSRDVLQDCRTLQAKVIELEGDRLQHGEAHVTTAQRVSELERELADVRGSSLSLESDARQAVIIDRLRISELEAALSERSGPDGSSERRMAELENELIDLRAEHEHQQHHAKISITRVAELEGQLGEHRATIDYYESQTKVYSGQILELQEQLGHASAAEEQHVQQHASHKSRISELEALVREAEGLKDQHAMQSKDLGTQVQQLMEEVGALRSSETTTAQALAVHRDKVSELEQQAEAQEGAHAKLHSSHRSRIQELEDELESARSTGETHARQLSNHKASLMEKDRENEELQLTQERHLKQHAVFKKQISDLEQQLAEAETATSNHTRQNNQHRLKINELEQSLEETRIVQENYVHQHGTQRLRIAELERELEEAQSGHDGQVRQQQTLRMKISELEQRLLETESGVETRAALESKQRDQIAALELELEGANTKEADHQRVHTEHKQSIADLEQEVEKLRGTHDSHLQHRTSLEQRNSELEQELEQIRRTTDQLMLEGRNVEDLKKELDSQQQLMSELKREFENERHNYVQMQQEDNIKIAALERQLKEADDIRGNVTELEKQNQLLLSNQVTELEKQNQLLLSNQAEIGKAQKKTVVELKQQLQEEQTRAKEQQERAEKLGIEMQTMQADFKDFMSKQDVVLTQKTIELEEAKSQIASLQSTLERPVQSAQPAVRNDAPRSSAPYSMYDDLTGMIFSDSQASIEPASQLSLTPTMGRRESLSAVVTTRRPSELKAPLLPASNDQFVEKVRQVDGIVATLFTEASESHADSIHRQMESALEAYKSGLEVRDSVQNYAASDTLEAKLESHADKALSAINDLRNLEKEIEMQGQLTASERASIQDRIQMNIKKLDDEHLLLRSRTGMRDIPESTMLTLIGVHGSGVSSAGYADGFTPMHWAAQSGRRDIVEYLLRLEGGKDLLNARDNTGKVPLYYAQKSKKEGLVQYLREVGATAPMHSDESRPDVSGLPLQYMQVLQQIETFGWQAMNWKDGYTMLHWAADKGHSDLCRYLVRMDADPSARDGKDRLPIEMANEAGCSETVTILKELMANPHSARGNINLQPFRANTGSFANAGGSGVDGGTAAQHLQSMMRGRTSTFASQLLSDDSESTASAGSKGIPEAYWNVMEQIDKVGWDKMQWARGFTLLHWAAKNDMPDLCSHFMFRRADPNHQDDNGRSAFDYATQESATSALEQLHRGAPAEEPKFQAFHKSSRKRFSLPVEAQPRASVMWCAHR